MGVKCCQPLNAALHITRPCPASEQPGLGATRTRIGDMANGKGKTAVLIRPSRLLAVRENAI